MVRISSAMFLPPVIVPLSSFVWWSLPFLHRSLIADLHLTDLQETMQACNPELKQ